MKKHAFMLAGALLVLLVLAAVSYFYTTFEMFPVNEELLATEEIPGSDRRLEAYLVDAGASSSALVQLRLVSDGGDPQVVRNFDTYDGLRSLRVLEDGQVEVVLTTGEGKWQTSHTVVISDWNRENRASSR